MRPPSIIDQSHAQFIVQAHWTAALRQYLLKIAGLTDSSNILETGCGTGVIASDLSRLLKARITGIDIHFESLLFLKRQNSGARIAAANGLALPFPNKTFDACVSHYYLLWMKDQQQAVSEMVRVTKDNGYVIAFAEPDYQARIDYPESLQIIGQLQNQSLQAKGASLATGRKLRELFTTARLKDVRCGVFGSEWLSMDKLADFEFEWRYLQEDLRPYLSTEAIDSLLEKDLITRENQQRVIFIPTFWAIGKV